MELKTFLSDPKIMARSGLIAMGFKLIVASALAILMNVFMDRSVFFAGVFILYPIVAFIVDLTLHFNKEKIWTILPTTVPDDWQTTSEQLLEYAKNLPKVRLMRFIICWIGILFIWSETGWNLVVGGMTALAMGFFFCSMFDLVWLNIFKIKKPEAMYSNTGQQNNIALWQAQQQQDLNLLRSRTEKMSINSNPSDPRSPLWTLYR